MKSVLEGIFPLILIPIIGFGIWRKNKKNKTLTQLKRICISIGISAFYLTEIVRSFYRPKIYQYNIFDFYIADTIGNTTGTITAIFILLSLSGKETISDIKLILIIIIGIICYEVFFSPSIDYRDIISTAIFGALSCILYFLLLFNLVIKKTVK